MNVLNLKEIFLNPSTIEVDSPLLSGDRIDETEVSLSRFGHIRLFFSSPDSKQPLFEKIFNWTQEKRQNSPYFFRPTWEREGDPYKNPSYQVSLSEWVLKKGGLELSASQEEIVFKTLKMLKARGLPVSSDE